MPIPGESPARIEERASLFERVTAATVNAPSFRPLSLTYNPIVFNVVAEAYFFLNSAYKAARLPAGSRTRPPKQAALSAVAVGVIQPIRPTTDDIRDPAYLHVNGALALRIACGAINKAIFDAPEYPRLRFYRFVQKLDFPSLKVIIDEANKQDLTLTTIFQPSLSADELAKLDLLVAYIETFVS